MSEEYAGPPRTAAPQQAWPQPPWPQQQAGPTWVEVERLRAEASGSRGFPRP